MSTTDSKGPTAQSLLITHLGRGMAGQDLHVRKPLATAGDEPGRGTIRTTLWLASGLGGKGGSGRSWVCVI